MITPFAIDLETGETEFDTEANMSAREQRWICDRLQSLPRFDVRSICTNFDPVSCTGDTKVIAYDLANGGDTEVTIKWSLDNSKHVVVMLLSQALHDPERIAKEMQRSPATRFPAITDISYDRQDPRTAVQRVVGNYAKGLPMIATPPMGFNCRSVATPLDPDDFKKVIPPLIIRDEE